MSKRLRYETSTTHIEKIEGRIIAHELSFEIEVGNGKYGVKIKQDQADSALVMHGGTLPAFIEALQEIQDLYVEAKDRYDRALDDSRPAPVTSVEGQTK